MKNHFSLLLAAVMLAGSAGCAGAPASSNDTAQNSKTEDAVSDQAAANAARTEKEASTDSNTAAEEKTQTVQNTPAADSKDLKTAYDAAVQAFKDKGYTITDQEYDSDEADFEFSGSGIRVDVSLERFPSLEAAQREYQEDTVTDLDSDETPGDRLENEKGSLTVLYNNENSTADIIALDTAGGILYSVDDVPQTDLDSVLSIMESIGFAVR